MGTIIITRREDYAPKYCTRQNSKIPERAPNILDKTQKYQTEVAPTYQTKLECYCYQFIFNCSIINGIINITNGIINGINQLLSMVLVIYYWY